MSTCKSPTRIHKVGTCTNITFTFNSGVNPVTLITASVMSIPASLAISKLRYPEEHEPLTSGRLVIARDSDVAANALHAFSNGAWFGLRVAGLILANVLTVLSLLSLVNGLLTYIGHFWVSYLHLTRFPLIT